MTEVSLETLRTLYDNQRVKVDRLNDVEFFGYVLEVLSRGVERLELKNEAFRGSHEDAHTALLELLLNERHVDAYNGKHGGDADLVIPRPGGRRWCVEAKILDPKHKKDRYQGGLFQLVDAYCRGREQFAIFLVYSRVRDTFALMDKMKGDLLRERWHGLQHLVEQPPFELPERAVNYSFVSEHQSAGRPLIVCHLWCNMYAPTRPEQRTATAKH